MLIAIVLASAVPPVAAPQLSAHAVAVAHARIVNAARISFSAPVRGLVKHKRGLVEFE